MHTNRLSIRPILAYCSGNFPVNLIAQMFATYAVFYYVDHLCGSSRCTTCAH